MEGLLLRADKELAHLTTNFQNHDEFNTAKAICDGSTLIEKLLRKQLYEKIGEQLPDLKDKYIIDRTKWNFSQITDKCIGTPFIKS